MDIDSERDGPVEITPAMVEDFLGQVGGVIDWDSLPYERQTLGGLLLQAARQTLLFPDRCLRRE